MANRLVTWALDQRTGSPTRKAVLLALADHANGHTGKCCPHMETIADELELSFRTVQRAVVDLCESGVITRSRTKRADGSWSGYHYNFPMSPVSSPPDSVSGGPPDSVSGQGEPEVNLEPITPPLAPPNGSVVVTRRWSVSGRTVTDVEDRAARAILMAYNEATGQSRSSVDALRMIVGRMREHPELSVGDHEHLIRDAVAHPWWKDGTNPNVIYGNGNVFESCLEAALARSRGEPTGGKQPTRYGRGMTTKQMLDTIPGGTT